MMRSLIRRRWQPSGWVGSICGRWGSRAVNWSQSGSVSKGGSTGTGLPNDHRASQLHDRGTSACLVRRLVSPAPRSARPLKQSRGHWSPGRPAIAATHQRTTSADRSESTARSYADCAPGRLAKLSSSGLRPRKAGPHLETPVGGGVVFQAAPVRIDLAEGLLLFGAEPVEQRLTQGGHIPRLGPCGRTATQNAGGGLEILDASGWIHRRTMTRAVSSVASPGGSRSLSTASARASGSSAWWRARESASRARPVSMSSPRRSIRPSV